MVSLPMLCFGSSGSGTERLLQLCCLRLMTLGCGGLKPCAAGSLGSRNRASVVFLASRSLSPTSLLGGDESIVGGLRFFVVFVDP
ncbi:hypothetical protein F2Q68_00042303 [Brassica cretica]|uniref:Uncharacterized protein n=1 Tax=Brassica cretica TaxID=69181 RepID=A0A8S9MND2_BRACR|nr:hypothetical protein F2Q68_00042303 [Brassica cretica]